MKKFFTLIATALVALSANAQTTTTWDFSKFTEQVTLADANVTVEYDGLTLTGNTTAGYTSDYVSASAGFHMNGASKTTIRHITYTPTENGKVTVTYKSNTSGKTDRIVAIGTTVVTGTDVATLLATDGVLAAGYTADGGATISADLTAGTKYYFYIANGGCSITKVVYEGNGVVPEITTTWDLADIYNADPALTDSVGEGSNASKHYMSSQQYSLLYNNSFAIVNGTSSKVEISSNSKTFSDNWKSSYRVATGGMGYATPGEGEPIPTTPTQRYVTFAVTAASTINVYAVGGGSGERTLYITDGTNVLNSWTTSDNSTTNIVAASTTGASTIYVYGTGSFNIYKVTATNAGTITKPEKPTAISTVSAAPAKANGIIKTANGIIKDGKKYNYAGQQMK